MESGTLLKEFEDYWYGPWKRTEPKVCTAEEFSWAAESFPKQSIFGPNLLEVPPPVLKPSRRTRNSANIPVKPHTGSQSGTHRCGHFLQPTRSFTTSARREKDIRSITTRARRCGRERPCSFRTSPRTDNFSLRNRPMPAAGSIREISCMQARSSSRSTVLQTWPLYGGTGYPSQATGPASCSQGRIGMLLPLETRAETSVQLLAPVADANRRASVTYVRLLDRDAAPVPLPFSEDHLAKVINEILGQPYGWGGLGGYRDCSSTILDVFLPFALPLPRNSRSQAGAGKNVTIEQLSLCRKARAHFG